jgi:glycosyltransferase involved in cell wall biosynthesis
VQLGLVTNQWMIRASTWLEELCYRKASLITGQTKGIVANIQQRMPHKEVRWVPNGVDLEAIGQAERAGDPEAARTRLGIAPNDLVLTYAGIIGHAQGLSVVLHAAESLKDRSDIHFLIIGDGPEKSDLLRLKERLGIPLVHFVDRMPRAELLTLLRASDAVVVPLRRNDLFKGAIPSKIFEALALAKPLLLGVEGEAKELFIEQGRAGLAFEPENAEALAGAVLQYADDSALREQHGANGARYVRAHFDRNAINTTLWEVLNTMLEKCS